MNDAVLSSAFHFIWKRTPFPIPQEKNEMKWKKKKWKMKKRFENNPRKPKSNSTALLISYTSFARLSYELDLLFGCAFTAAAAAIATATMTALLPLLLAASFWFYSSLILRVPSASAQSVRFIFVNLVLVDLI